MSRNHPWYQDNPVGDPFGGPAYGKYEDPQTLGLISSGLGAYLGYSGAQGAAGQLVGASNAANATLGALTGQGIGALNTSTDLAAQLSNPSRQTGNYAQQALAAALGLPQQAMGPTSLPGGGTLQGTNQLGPLSGSLASALTPFTYGADQFQSSPGYQFALQQGLNTIQNNAAAKGMLLSPNTIKDLSTYATGVANQDYQQQYQNAYQAYTQNQSNVLNTLGSLMGQGNAATNNLTSNITNAGSNISNLLSSLGVAQANNQLGAGSAAAAGRVGATNALTGGLGNISNLLSAGRFLGSGSDSLGTVGNLLSNISPGAAGSLGDLLGMSIGGTYGSATQAGLDSLVSSLLNGGSGAAAAGAGTAGAGAAGGIGASDAAGGLGAAAAGAAIPGWAFGPLSIAVGGMLGGIMGKDAGPSYSNEANANNYAIYADSQNIMGDAATQLGFNINGLTPAAYGGSGGAVPLYSMSQLNNTYGSWLTPAVQQYMNSLGQPGGSGVVSDPNNSLGQWITAPNKTLMGYMYSQFGLPGAGGQYGYSPDQWGQAQNYFQSAYGTNQQAMGAYGSGDQG